MRRQLLKNILKGVGVFLSGLIADLLKDRYIGAINRWLDAHASGPLHSAASWIVNRPYALTIGGVLVFGIVLVLHAAIVSRAKYPVADTPESPPEEKQRPPITDDAQNLRVDFSGIQVGKIYLTPEGIWSASPSSGATEYRDSIRIIVGNAPMDGRAVGVAKGVAANVEFRHANGIRAASAAPTAWMHEIMGSVDIDVGYEKEAIVAVRTNGEWSAVSNVRIPSTYPMNRTAMRFQEVPWFKGFLHVAIVCDGKAVEQTYGWEATQNNIRPNLTKITPAQPNAETPALPLAGGPKVVLDYTHPGRGVMKDAIRTVRNRPFTLSVDRANAYKVEIAPIAFSVGSAVFENRAVLRVSDGQIQIHPMIDKPGGVIPVFMHEFDFLALDEWNTYNKALKELEIPITITYEDADGFKWWTREIIHLEPFTMQSKLADIKFGRGDITPQ